MLNDKDARIAVLEAENRRLAGEVANRNRRAFYYETQETKLKAALERARQTLERLRPKWPCGAQDDVDEALRAIKEATC